MKIVLFLLLAVSFLSAKGAFASQSSEHQIYFENPSPIQFCYTPSIFKISVSGPKYTLFIKTERNSDFDRCYCKSGNIKFRAIKAEDGKLKIDQNGVLNETGWVFWNTISEISIIHTGIDEVMITLDCE